MSRARFLVRKYKKMNALLIIDVQNDFIPGFIVCAWLEKENLPVSTPNGIQFRTGGDHPGLAP